MTSKTCIIITGPTAAGKTALAITAARHFNTEIISADSRQCFREMSIGVAKPSPEQLQQVHHYFINSHSIHDDVNAAVFEQYALDAADKIFQHHDVAVMVGGTGLYIKAFCEGLDDMPPVSPEIREQISTQFKEKGLEWLQQQVQQHDPVYYSNGEIQNPQRLMRALEVKLATGQSIRSFQGQKTVTRPFNVIKIGLELPKEVLHSNIDQRVHEMVEQGLVAEVTDLLPFRNLNALRTVGYSEIFDYLDNTITLPEAIALIQKNTRQYAKRQLTWFKKDKAIRWFHPTAVHEVLNYSTSRL
ncbi:MAG: tRNA (adenosine(37)-N6)-dimethylallyltransferase MiaA [Chitinophagaceae bacterium]